MAIGTATMIMMIGNMAIGTATTTMMIGSMATGMATGMVTTIMTSDGTDTAIERKL